MKITNAGNDKTDQCQTDEKKKLQVVAIRRVKKTNLQKKKAKKIKKPQKKKVKFMQSTHQKCFKSFKKQERLEKKKQQKEEYNSFLEEIKKKEFNEENEKKCIFVLRNNVICLNQKSIKILQELKLEKKFTGILIMNTKKNLKKLFLVKPFVCYGYINKRNLINLMSKSLRLQFNGKEEKVDGNEFIEKKFKTYGFHYFEDLCNYIYNCEKKASKILNKHFLPFDFTFLRKNLNFDLLQIEIELAGYVKDEINKFLEKVC